MWSQSFGKGERVASQFLRIGTGGVPWCTFIRAGFAINATDHQKNAKVKIMNRLQIVELKP